MCVSSDVFVLVLGLKYPPNLERPFLATGPSEEGAAQGVFSERCRPALTRLIYRGFTEVGPRP